MKVKLRRERVWAGKYEIEEQIIRDVRDKIQGTLSHKYCIEERYMYLYINYKAKITVNMK